MSDNERMLWELERAVKGCIDAGILQEINYIIHYGYMLERVHWSATDEVL